VAKELEEKLRALLMGKSGGGKASSGKATADEAVTADE
jgi:hypothetical protein